MKLLLIIIAFVYSFCYEEKYLSSSDCLRVECSCVDTSLRTLIHTCVNENERMCYRKYGMCERQMNGKCDFTSNDNLTNCIGYGSSIGCKVGGCWGMECVPLNALPTDYYTCPRYPPPHVNCFKLAKCEMHQNGCGFTVNPTFLACLRRYNIYHY